MASWQAHLAVALFRWRIKRRLSGCSNVARVREVFNSAASLYRTPADVRLTGAELGGVPCEWVTSKSTNGLTLLYLHGGGYVGCSPLSHHPITVAYARKGFLVCVPDYRLAPENPFPAAVEDAVAVYRQLLTDHPAGRIVVSGDSAGGGLALAMLISARDLGFPLPAASALFSPWVDLAATGDSLVENDACCAMFRGRDIGPGARAYLQNTDARNPLASPLYADLHGMPPMLIHAGQNEVLRDDSVRLAQRAQEAGVTVQIKLWPVVPHCWQIVYFMPEARQSLQIAGDFLTQCAASSKEITHHAQH